MPYREFLLSYKMPNDITVFVSFCGDSFACSWSKTFSRGKNGYIPRPEFDIGPTIEFEWYNIQGDNGMEFLENLKKEQGTQDYCPCFLEAGFIELGNVYGYLTFLDLVNGGIVTIHEEGVYDMMIADKVNLHAPACGRITTHESLAGAFGIPELMPPIRRRDL